MTMRYTNEENERIWWQMGLPHVAEAFAAATCVEALEDAAAEIEDAHAATKGQLEECREALRTLVAIRPELAPAITSWLDAPDLHDFDKLCDTL